MKQINVKQQIGFLLLASMFLLAGCATPMKISTPSCPELPVRPSLRQPPPTQPYLQSVETNMQKWEQRQQDINQMLQH